MDSIFDDNNLGNSSSSSNHNYTNTNFNSTTAGHSGGEFFEDSYDLNNFHGMNTKAKDSYEIPHQQEQQRQQIQQQQDYTQNFNHRHNYTYTDHNNIEMMGVTISDVNRSMNNSLQQPHSQAVVGTHYNNQQQQRPARAALEPEGDYSTAEGAREIVTQWSQELSPNSHIYSYNGTSSGLSNTISNELNNAPSKTNNTGMNNNNHNSKSNNHNDITSNSIAYEYKNTTITSSDDIKSEPESNYLEMIGGQTQDEEIMSTSVSTTKDVKDSSKEDDQQDDLNVPPWSTSGSQIPLPRRRQQISVKWGHQQNEYLSSFREQWSNIEIKMSTVASNQHCTAHPPPPTSSSINPSMHPSECSSSLLLHNTDIDIDMSRHMGNISNIHRTEQIDKNMLSENRKIMIKSQARDKFYRAIENDKIQIKNDTSITGRYNTKRKYKPFGFVPSTERACQEEIYEVIKPSQYFYSDDNKNPMKQQHYQSWDPKTMQYSPQPYNMFQPICNGAQYPMTPGLNAAAGTRAALLSFMTKTNDTSPPEARTSASSTKRLSFSKKVKSNSLGLNLAIFDSEDKDHLQFGSSNNNNNHNSNGIPSINSTTGIDGGFDRRHSLYIPSARSSSYEPMNELDLLPTSSSNRFQPFASNSHSEDYAGQNSLSIDNSAMEGAENVWQIPGHHVPLSSSSNKQRMKKQRSQEHTKKRRTTSPMPKRKKKSKDEQTSSTRRKSSSSLRRSGRRRQRRSFDDDSSLES